MSEVGIRALKQNASEVVARVAAGEVLTVTDRGRPVAQLSPVPQSRIAGLVDAGLARPARHDLAGLPAPEPGPNLTEALRKAREDERY